MSLTFKEFGFYHVDVPYLKYLHDNIDSEVYYSEEKTYDRKPFLGILVIIGTYTYLIPLTSRKEKHKNWKNVDRGHYLIYETVDKDEVCERDIIKSCSENTVIKLLAALDIRKMIPVPDGLYERININEMQDKNYRNLLLKEYWFCQKIQTGIATKAEKIYFEQKSSGKIFKFYCNYSKLEKACDEYAGCKV